jgi:hypothetical protein
MSTLRGGANFPLGQIVMTSGVADLIDANGHVEGTTVAALIRRHVTGDWGDVPPEDATENESALQHGTRLMSVYRLSPRLTLWVITEADRSVTTVLLPSEY